MWTDNDIAILVTAPREGTIAGGKQALRVDKLELLLFCNASS